MTEYAHLKSGKSFLQSSQLVWGPDVNKPYQPSQIWKVGYTVSDNPTASNQWIRIGDANFKIPFKIKWSFIFIMTRTPTPWEMEDCRSIETTNPNPWILHGITLLSSICSNLSHNSKINTSYLPISEFEMYQKTPS